MANIDKELNKVTEKAEHLEEKVEQESFAMSMLREYSRNAKRWFTIAIVILCMWLSTIGVFIWYLYQYDYVSESTVTVDGKEGIALYQDGKGNVLNNGENSEKNNEETN